MHRTGKHPIDKGAGAMFHARLEEHAARVLGQEPVVYTGTSIKISKPVGGLPPYVPAGKMADAMAAARLDAVRTVVLYESAAWRTRVMGQLARDYARPELADLPDEQPVVLAPGYELVAVRLPELVRHGSHDRGLILNSLPWFKPGAGRSLVTALCETRYPSEQEKEAGVTDAKHALKGLFAERGIPSQFITMDSDPGDPYRLNTPEKVARAKARSAGLPEPDIAYKDDHAVQIGLGSLHCDSGIIDNRLAATAFHHNARDTALDREAVAVGLWTRYHRFAERPGRPRKPAVLAITLVAMRIPLGEDAYWPTLMYSDRGWLPWPRPEPCTMPVPSAKRASPAGRSRGPGQRAHLCGRGPGRAQEPVPDHRVRRGAGADLARAVQRPARGRPCARAEPHRPGVGCGGRPGRQRAGHTPAVPAHRRRGQAASQPATAGHAGENPLPSRPRRCSVLAVFRAVPPARRRPAHRHPSTHAAPCPAVN